MFTLCNFVKHGNKAAPLPQEHPGQDAVFETAVLNQPPHHHLCPSPLCQETLPVSGPVR